MRALYVGLAPALLVALASCGAPGEPSSPPPAADPSAPPAIAAPASSEPAAPTAPAFEPPIQWEGTVGIDPNARIELTAEPGARASLVSTEPVGAWAEGVLSPALDQRMTGARACYATAHAVHRYLHGHLYLRLRLTAEGQVEDVSLVDAPSEHVPAAEWWIAGSAPGAPREVRAAEACVLADARAWTLPPPDGASASLVVGIELDVQSILDRPPPTDLGVLLWGGWSFGGGSLTRVPRVRLGAPTVSPDHALSREVVRRVVRRHVNEVRFCYEQALHRAPELAGRLDVRWEVSPTGMVRSAEDLAFELEPGSTAGRGPREVRHCVAAAVRRWTFPVPDHAPATVTLSIELDSEDAGDEVGGLGAPHHVPAGAGS